jgi:repressor LexA
MSRRFDEDLIQQGVLDEIVNALWDGRPVPTTRELARAVYAAESRVQTALDSLEDERYIERDKDSSGKSISRAIRPTKMSRVRFIPLMGRIAAGKPIPAYGDDVEEYLPLPVTQVRGDGAYALRVEGDSMTGDSLLDGDYVIVAPDPEPNDGEMVVVVINGGATVKRLWREEGRIRLESSNPDRSEFPPMIIDHRDDPLIQGRVVGVIRWLS